MHLKFSTILKTSKKVYEVMFFDMQKYIYSESVFNTLYIETKHKFLKEFTSDQKWSLVPLASSNSSQF